MTTEQSADEAAKVRGAFRQAADFYLETVAGVPADRWSAPALAATGRTPLPQELSVLG